MSAILEVHDLVVAYGGNQALAVPHLAVGRGELVGVVGANGAGKSTLVHSIRGWSRGGAPRARPGGAGNGAAGSAPPAPASRRWTTRSPAGRAGARASPAR